MALENPNTWNSGEQGKTKGTEPEQSGEGVNIEQEQDRVEGQSGSGETWRGGHSK